MHRGSIVARSAFGGSGSKCCGIRLKLDYTGSAVKILGSRAALSNNFTALRRLNDGKKRETMSEQFLFRRDYKASKIFIKWSPYETVYNGVYTSELCDTGCGKRGKGHCAVSFPRLFELGRAKNKKRKRKIGDEQQRGDDRDGKKSKRTPGQRRNNEEGETWRSIVLKSFAEARLIFKLLAPLDNDRTTEERNEKENRG